MRFVVACGDRNDLAQGGCLYGFIEKERTMREVHLPLPELGLIAGTRVALGVGLGLLVAIFGFRYVYGPIESFATNLLIHTRF